MNLVILDDKFSNTMYSYIGMFERKLKEQVINNCCQLYVEIGDLTCTSYSQEIKDVIDKKRETPTFAPNLY